MAVQQTLTTDPLGGAGGALAAGGQYGAGRDGGVAYGAAAAGLHGTGGWRPGVGGILQRPYKQERGFCVLWDYLLGLPKRSGSKVIGKVRFDG